MQIISGVSQLRNGKSRGVLLLDSRRETLKDISRMLGNDLPLNSVSSPPFQSQNSLSSKPSTLSSTPWPTRPPCRPPSSSASKNASPR